MDNRAKDLSQKNVNTFFKEALEASIFGQAGSMEEPRVKEAMLAAIAKLESDMQIYMKAMENQLSKGGLTQESLVKIYDTFKGAVYQQVQKQQAIVSSKHHTRSSLSNVQKDVITMSRSEQFTAKAFAMMEDSGMRFKSESEIQRRLEENERLAAEAGQQVAKQESYGAFADIDELNKYAHQEKEYRKEAATLRAFSIQRSHSEFDYSKMLKHAREADQRLSSAMGKDRIREEVEKEGRDSEFYFKKAEAGQKSRDESIKNIQTQEGRIEKLKELIETNTLGPEQLASSKEQLVGAEKELEDFRRSLFESSKQIDENTAKAREAQKKKQEDEARMSRGIMIAGAGARAAGAIAEELMFKSDIRHMAAQTSMANVLNQVYFNAQDAISQPSFGGVFRTYNSISAIDTAGSMLEHKTATGSTQFLGGLLQVIAGAKTGGLVGGLAAAPDVLKSGIDLSKGTVQLSAEAMANEEVKKYLNTITAVPLAKMDAAISATMNINKAAIGGGSGMAKFANNIFDTTFVDSLANLGVDATTDIPGLLSSLKGARMGESGVASALKTIGEGSRKGIFSKQEGAALIGDFVSGGGSNREFEELMYRAIREGMNDSTSMNELVKASNALSADMRKMGVGSPESSRILMNVVSNLNNMGFDPRYTAGMALDKINTLNKKTSDTSISYDTLIEMESLMASGLDIYAAENAAELSFTDVENLQGLKTKQKKIRKQINSIKSTSPYLSTEEEARVSELESEFEKAKEQERAFRQEKGINISTEELVNIKRNKAFGSLAQAADPLALKLKKLLAKYIDEQGSISSDNASKALQEIEDSSLTHVAGAHNVSTVLRTIAGGDATQNVMNNLPNTPTSQADIAVAQGSLTIIKQGNDLIDGLAKVMEKFKDTVPTAETRVGVLAEHLANVSSIIQSSDKVGADLGKMTETMNSAATTFKESVDKFSKSVGYKDSPTIGKKDDTPSWYENLIRDMKATLTEMNSGNMIKENNTGQIESRKK